MKNNFVFAILGAMLILVSACNKEGNGNAESAALDTRLDSNSYAMGMDFAQSYLQAQSIDINYEAFYQGLKDVLDENLEPIFDETLKNSCLMNFQQDIKAGQEEKMKAEAAQYKEEGRKFLEENKTKDGVIETESGLQYKIIEPGNDHKPAVTDIVQVHYRGKLLDGTEFDSSYDRGEPITFELGKLIQGWKEGLQYIGIGGKIELYVKSELAYGDSPAGKIPGGSTLIFEVELLDILPEMPAE